MNSILLRLLTGLFMLTSGVFARAPDIRLEQARAWAKKGMLDEAVREYRLILNEHPESPEVYLEMGHLLMRHNQLKSAVQNFRRALDKKPDLTNARLGLAQAYEKAGEVENSLTEWRALREATRDTMQLTRIKKRISELETIKRRPTGPAESDTALVPENPIYRIPIYRKAVRLYLENKRDSALVAIGQTLAQHPGHPGAFYYAGVIRYDRGETGKAIYNFKRSLGFPEKGFNAHFYLGRIYQKKGSSGLARKEYEKYLQATKSPEGKKQVEAFLLELPAPQPEKFRETSNPLVEKPVRRELQAPASMDWGAALRFYIPDSSDAAGKRLLKALAEAREGLYDRAIGFLKDVVLNFKGSDNAKAAVLNLGSLYLKMGLAENTVESIKDYAEGLESDFYTGPARFLMAHARLASGNWKSADSILPFLKPNALIGPSKHGLYSALARAAELSGNLGQAVTYLEKALREPVSPLEKAMLYQRLGASQLQAGNETKAREYLKKSLLDCSDTTLAEVCSESQLRLADTDFRFRRWSPALKGYFGILKKNPTSPDAAWIHYQIGNIYLNLNELASALTEYKKVMEGFPDSYWAAQAKWKREDAVWHKEYGEVLN